MQPSRDFIPIDQEHNLANKRRVQAAQQNLTQAPSAELGEAIAASYHEEADFRATHPVNHVVGRAAIESEFWQHLRRALPDAERRECILAGGFYQGRELVASYGQYLGTFEQDWFGIPASKRPLIVRYCEAHELADGRIARSWTHIDYLDIMRQVGYWPVAPSLGEEGAWLGPMTNDGVILTAQDEATTRRAFDVVMAMQAALGYFSGRPPTREVLDEMVQARFWHPQFMWYGPAGIGSTRGLAGFENFHQIPFLVTFPDRGKVRSPEGHYLRIGDGKYAVTGGWEHLIATHTGGEWLGLAPTGQPVTMRVMDFYRCELTDDDDGSGPGIKGASIRENWVPIDIPHILYQLGVDIFGRMRHQFRQQRAISASEFLVS